MAVPDPSRAVATVPLERLLALSVVRPDPMPVKTPAAVMEASAVPLLF